MAIVSYAQNLEDVILQRVFDRDSGTYVDVGANDPVVDSTSYAFYLRGWRGVAVEPQAAHHRRACGLRPGDVNVQALASDREGTVTFYEVTPWHGLSTLDPDIAARHVADGYAVAEREVRALTLTGILDVYLHGRPIDFLAIDAEGAEPMILAGLDFRRYRPAVVMFEAMAPVRQIDVSAPSEALLRAAGYAPVYEDGLNRFFLADEQAALAPRFRFPPNVFDDYRTAREIELQAALDAARRRIADLEAARRDGTPDRGG